MSASVAVSIANFNDRRYLPSCLEALRNQTLPPSAVVVVDNGSQDDSVVWLRAHAPDVQLITNSENRGFAAAHNQGIRGGDADYVLVLNCDLVLAPEFLEAMARALDADASAGSACGRLYRGRPGENNRLDSTGLYPDRFRRFHDRDHNAIDSGQRCRPEYVFGSSGSAVVFRRAMLEDTAEDGCYFDELFFAYYEDVDLAWRARRRGWNCRFVPDARGWHVHEDTSRARSKRRDQHAVFRQMLLARNRHLCFLKNDRWRDLGRDLPWLLGYDLALEGYLTAKHAALGVRWPLSLAGLLPEIGRKRARAFAASRRDVSLADWLDPERFHPAP